MEAAGANSWTQWADRARKAVAETVAYDAVPQGDAGGAGDLDDLENGEALSQWASWAKMAAGRVQQQAAGAAEEARKGLSQAAEKAKGADWGGEVVRSLSSVADGTTRATLAFSEKGKVAQQLAKDLGGKGQKQLAAAGSKAKEKAAAAAAGAKAGLSQAGQSLSGLSALTLSPVKLAQFGGLFFFGVFLISMSFSFLPILAIAPQKFALLFALGSSVLLSSFAVLKGPKSFFTGLLQRDKLPFSIAYAVGLIGTLIATIVMRSYLLTAFFGIMQAVGLLYFIASYVPGGKSLLNFCGRLGGRAARMVVGSVAGTK